LNILIPGGAGYIGATLVPWLLADGHKVTVYDTFLFGSAFLPDNPNLKIIKADVRNNIEWARACAGQEAVIYLASISSESVCKKNPSLAHEVNVECFEPNLLAAKEIGVKRFIYASSVAVYGSSNPPTYQMSEFEPPNPTTIYGNGKFECDKILFSHDSEDFSCTSVRSASVCGYSPRQRLDLTINRMVHDACRKRVITVEGGSQIRSHVHIQDLCDFYKLILKTRTDLVGGQSFNVVMENQTVKYSAEMVQKLIPCEISVKERVDDRSYSVSGFKASDMLQFRPKRSLEKGVLDLKARFDGGSFKDSETNPIYQNIINV